jgi:hypothetical protein
MNDQEFEQYLISELLDGHPNDVLCHMDAASIEEEFCELLFVWSMSQKDADALKDGMQRFLVGMIDRIVKEQNLTQYEQSAEDAYIEYQDRLYQERKDRELEILANAKKAVSK